MSSALAVLARSRVAPTLLMFIMLASGILAAGRIETRFFPEFEIQVVVVSVPWSGAAAEDVDNSLITPLHNHLRDVKNYKSISSVARDGSAIIYLEFPANIDLDTTVEDVRRQVDLAAGSLPADSETPIVKPPAGFGRDQIMKLSLNGNNLTELRPLARSLETQLLALGVSSVEVTGLPKDEVNILLDQRQLAQIELSLREVGQQIARQNVDISAGKLQGSQSGRLLRAVSQQRDINGLADLKIVDGAGSRVRLGDIAIIERSQNDSDVTLLFNGKPAVEFSLVQLAGSDIIASAAIINAWLDEIRPTFPPGIGLTAHDKAYEPIQSRTELLILNGLTGLLLVMALLFIFLNARVALWVSAGIPATFMVALATLYGLGGSINMLSLFAFIMTTGIVVDDAIVVGENAHYRLQQGDPPMQAAVRGAREMLVSVCASTGTTVAAFIPLFVVGGVIGAIMFDIPLVVVCVLLASLFECFMVLPGHLTGAFRNMPARDNRFRAAIDRGFEYFQENLFRRWLAFALRYRLCTIVLAFMMLAISVAMLLGGVVKYRFFDGGELGNIDISANFSAGTPVSEVKHFASHLEAMLKETEASYPDEKELLKARSLFFAKGGERRPSGSETFSMNVEMSEPDTRKVRAEEFLRAWRQRVKIPAGLETFDMQERRGGPPGEDFEVQLTGNSAEKIKMASLELQTQIAQLQGLSLPRDDMPYGQQQEIFELTPLGESLGLSVDDVATQLRDSFDGYKAQTFYEGADEVEVRVVMTGDDNPQQKLSGFLIRLPSGKLASLLDVAQLRSRRGFDQLQREGTDTVVNINAEVDFDVTDISTLQKRLNENELPQLAAKYGVGYSFEGSSSDERETVADMKVGLVIAVALIYIILVAVFASWTLPLVVLLTLPMSITGAIIGHWLMGYTMSILSAFGVLTLNGIVINDSIVLLREYLSRRRASPDSDTDELIMGATCRRFRAMLLTSITTIAGLTPLIFEQSTQAQFLIPMAISICFGLGFATVLILIVAPIYLSYHESAVRMSMRVRHWLFSTEGREQTQ
jgi:multidrug efflux pump subunit AcrB